ncbi:MAG: hypothetical protein ACREB2_13085, partial [Pseudolabrys sp.]
AIVAKLNKDVRAVLAAPDIQERLRVLGTYTRELNPAQTAAFIKDEEALWWPIVRKVEAENGPPAK